jgi:fermentation-respiration switch protein FrsA (DUF1100 family)
MLFSSIQREIISQSSMMRMLSASQLWQNANSNQRVLPETMKTLLILFSVAVSIYLLLLLALYLLQDKMVFLPNMPGRALTASPGDLGLEYEDVSLATSDGERLHGWYVPAPKRRGVVLFFHGNAGNISHRLDSVETFHQLGLDTLIIDYRGYGQSTGKATEQGTYLDAQAAWDYLVNERGVPAERIIVFGRSLGGAIGTWLGAQHTPAGVIIESSFTSGVDIARRFYPFLPAHMITRLRYPVAEYASRLECPVLVVHSRDDEIIPFDMGQSIYAAVKQRKSFLELRGDHNNGFFLSRHEYVPALDGVIESVLGPGTPQAD